MDPNVTFAIAVGIFAAAVLYASVGHGGASGYLAVMALANLAPEVMKPTALVLNCLVATLGTIKFARAGCFRWDLFWPFVIGSAPLAFIGGGLELPGVYYKPLVGAVLVFAAVRLLVAGRPARTDDTRPLPLAAALPAGAGIGLLSGITGVGGGIFLSPLLLFMRWATPKETTGVSVAFILVNSIAGILGHQRASLGQVPEDVVWWGLAAVAGGWIGADLGSRRLNSVWLCRVLGVVLVIAGLKFIFAA